MEQWEEEIPGVSREMRGQTLVRIKDDHLERTGVPLRTPRGGTDIQWFNFERFRRSLPDRIYGPFIPGRGRVRYSFPPNTSHNIRVSIDPTPLRPRESPEGYALLYPLDLDGDAERGVVFLRLWNRPTFLQELLFVPRMPTPASRSAPRLSCLTSWIEMLTEQLDEKE